jgi:RimJ/RimL family protein N-acetyltransferase
MQAMGTPDVIAATDRIVLRSWRVDEADRFYDMHRRPEVARWIGGQPMARREEATALIERYIARLDADPRFGVWAVIERSSDTPAGSVLLKPLPDGDGEIEIGWHLHPDSWGRGLATEAGRALLARGLGLGLQEIWAVSHLENHRSVRVCHKLGMQLLGVTHRWYHEPSLMFWIGARPEQPPSLSPDEPAPQRATPNNGVIVEIEPPDSKRARALLCGYLEEVVGRYHGRSATDAEMQRAFEEFASDDLASPQGILLVACADGAVVGCVGLRYLADLTGEVRRLFVARHARGQQIATQLMDTLEMHARDRGLARLRLDTRHDLAEARALYHRRGYREVSPFNDSPYADHWFEKTLT